ncbi:hypothetical protein BJY04DRAFT_175429 [Aspergillus karnatakaensis]|uniref:uncharacterized protein n=1 Tax=Aspergillus karnatakaensis TaxID=1810916 RepID=UPI003CCDCE4D
MNPRPQCTGDCSDPSRTHTNPADREISVGNVLPSRILHIPLRSKGRNKTSLQQILNDCTGDIIVHVFSRVSKEQLRLEYEMVSTWSRYPHIDLTSVVISTYPASVLSSDAVRDWSGCEDNPRLVLSDPSKHLLEAMGFVRPPPSSKAVATRQRHLGGIRSGFFIVKKDGTLYAWQTGTVDNLSEGIFRAERKLHGELAESTRGRGGVLPPW